MNTKKRCAREEDKETLCKGKIDIDIDICDEKFIKASKSQGSVMGYGRACGVFEWILNSLLIYVVR